MKFLYAFFLLVLFGTQAIAHEMTPTYPELRPSYMDGLSSINLNLFNRREDVSYYEIEVFDEEWVPVPFAAKEKLIKINYLGRIDLQIYIRDNDKNRVTYICTLSKILNGDVQTSGVTSRICSKIKRD